MLWVSSPCLYRWYPRWLIGYYRFGAVIDEAYFEEMLKQVFGET